MLDSTSSWASNPAQYTQLTSLKRNTQKPRRWSSASHLPRDPKLESFCPDQLNQLLWGQQKEPWIAIHSRKATMVAKWLSSSFVNLTMAKLIAELVSHRHSLTNANHRLKPLKMQKVSSKHLKCISWTFKTTTQETKIPMTILRNPRLIRSQI